MSGRQPKFSAARRAEIAAAVRLRRSIPTLTQVASTYGISMTTLLKIADGEPYRNAHDDDQPNGALPC